jgi:hypothetical protein
VTISVSTQAEIHHGWTFQLTGYPENIADAIGNVGVLKVGLNDKIFRFWRYSTISRIDSGSNSSYMGSVTFLIAGCRELLSG